MTTPPYSQLAKEFMDLWQKQVASVISDKQFIHAMLQLFQTITPHASATADPAASHPAHTADAHARLLDELSFRLTMCERRLAELEKPKPKSAKRSKSGS